MKLGLQCTGYSELQVHWTEHFSPAHAAVVFVNAQ